MGKTTPSGAFVLRESQRSGIQIALLPQGNQPSELFDFRFTARQFFYKGQIRCMHHLLQINLPCNYAIQMFFVFIAELLKAL